jgi:hypothetical protein
MENTTEQGKVEVRVGPEYGRPVKYGAYTEEEARSHHGKLFAAIDKPNVIDLD